MTINRINKSKQVREEVHMKIDMACNRCDEEVRN